MQSADQQQVTADLAILNDAAVRRLAKRKGYYVTKSRKIHFRLDDQGQYSLRNPDNGFPVYGHYHDASLEEIADWLKDEPDAD